MHYIYITIGLLFICSFCFALFYLVLLQQKDASGDGAYQTAGYVQYSHIIIQDIFQVRNLLLNTVFNRASNAVLQVGDMIYIAQKKTAARKGYFQNFSTSFFRPVMLLFNIALIIFTLVRL